MVRVPPARAPAGARRRLTTHPRARAAAGAAFVVLALLAAACGAVEEAVDEVVTPAEDGAPAAEVPGAPDAPPPNLGPPGSPGDAGAAGAPAPPAGPQTDPATGGQHHHAPPGGVDAQPDGTGPPGSFAPVLLRPQLSDRLVIETYVQPGAEPRPASLDRTRRIVEEVTGKPVRVAGPVAVPGDRRSWSGDDIRAAADVLAGERHGDGQAVIRLLFLRGGFAESEQALGVAVRGDAGAVFVERIRATGTPLVGAGPIEEAVTLHEVGHLLGLVDLYHDTGRADPDHPGHSPNPRSVMYWAVQTTMVVDVLRGGPPRDFDADDLADLAAIRAGAGG